MSPDVRSSGIRNPGNLGPWNPESTALESGIQLMESLFKQSYYYYNFGNLSISATEHELAVNSVIWAANVYFTWPSLFNGES